MAAKEAVLAVHEQWEQGKAAWVKEAQELKRVEAMRCLYPVTRRTGPFWESSMFCDLVHPGLSSSPTEKAFEEFVHLLMRTVEEQKTYLEQRLDEGGRAVLDKVIVGFAAGVLSWRRSFLDYVLPFITEVARRISALEPGDVLVLPCFTQVLSGCLLVVPEPDGEHFHIAVVDTGIDNTYHPKVATPSGGMQQHTVVGFDKVPKENVNEGWWLWVALSKGLDDEEVYTKILSPLFEQHGTYAQGVEAWLKGSAERASIPVRPQKTGTLIGALQHSLWYLLRYSGMRQEQIGVVETALQMQVMKWTLNDLHTVKALAKPEKKLLELGFQNFARRALANKCGEKHIFDTVEYVRATMKGLSAASDGEAAPPPLDLDTGKNAGVNGHDYFPHFESLRRLEDVDDFAGPPIPHPRFLPADFLVFRGRAQTFREVITVLHDLDRLCTRVAVQHTVIKNATHLKFSLISHVLLEMLPMPLSHTKREAGKCCVWQDVPMLHAEMSYCMELLRRVCLHWAATVCSLRDAPELGAFKITIPAMLACMADAVLRNPLSDRESLLTRFLEGDAETGKFGVGVGAYIVQSEAMSTTYPMLLEGRAAVIDYLEQRNIPKEGCLFRWEDGMKHDAGSFRLMRAMAYANAFPVSQAQEYLVGDSDPHYLIIMNCPEFKRYRDICFYFKFFMSSEKQVKPMEFSQFDAIPRFAYIPCMGYRVKAFNNYLNCKTKKKPKLSYATASRFTYPNVIENEDDLLHLPSLPTFDVLSQSDSELLLSYLTVPYVRIPLILEFFATEERVSALRSKMLRRLLDSVLFEPARFQHQSMEGKVPKTVPAETPDLLSTPYGLLLNELQHGAEGVTRPLLRLLKLAQELDAGTVLNTSAVDVILYLVRTIARVDVFIKHLLERVGGARELVVPREELELAHSTIRVTMETDVKPMLRAWVDEVMLCHVTGGPEGKPKERSDDPLPVAEATVIASRVYAHLVLIERAGTVERSTVTSLVASFVFLTTRHTWNAGKMGEVPEVELYDTLHEWREGLVLWMMRNGESKGDILWKAVNTATSSVGGELDLMWGMVGGEGSLGRFTISEEEVHLMDPQLLREANEGLRKGMYGDDIPEGVLVIPEGKQSTEVNLQTMQITFKTAHLRGLDTKVATDADVGMLLKYLEAETATVQCADVEQTEHREWVRLVGLDVDVQHWRTPEPRVVIPETSGRDYPEGANAHEEWVVALAEPVRLSYFMRPPWEPPIIFTFPEKESTADTNVVCLEAIDSKNGEKLKELHVYRDHSCVMVYDLFSYGRRFYRSLVYSSDSRVALRWIQPSDQARRVLWDSWNRHAGGNPRSSLSTPSCCVLSRTKFAAGNLSGCRETFVPPRLLHGLLPDALLDTHVFFQDEKDDLRGYPMKVGNDNEDDEPSHLLLVTLHEKPGVGGVDTSTVARVLRYSDPSLCHGKGHEAKATLKAGVEDGVLLLLDPLHAPKGTPLHSLARVLMRVESLSHVLVWTRDLEADPAAPTPLSIDVVQLPRLKLSFTAREEGGVTRLYSLDHSNLFVSNRLTDTLLRLIDGIPQSLLLQDAEDQVSILVPAFLVSRPPIAKSPLSTELVVLKDQEWLEKLDVRYHLYHVHVSLAFLFTPTLASALFLVWMRFLARDYASVFELASTIGTDAGLSGEEEEVYLKITAVDDKHPDALACKVKVWLASKDIPCVPECYFPMALAEYLLMRDEVSAGCRITPAEELRAIEASIQLEAAVVALKAKKGPNQKDPEEVRLHKLITKFEGQCPLPEYYSTLLHNRLACLQSSGGPVHLKLPPLGPDDGGVLHVDNCLLEGDLSNVTVSTTLSSTNSCFSLQHGLRGMLNTYKQNKAAKKKAKTKNDHPFGQPTFGMFRSEYTWLQFYLLMIGQTKCKMTSGSHSPHAGFTVASIARHFMKEAYAKGDVGKALMHLAAANRTACLDGTLPKFPASVKVSLSQTITTNPENHERLLKTGGTPKLKKKEGGKDTRPPLAVMLEEAREAFLQSQGKLRMTEAECRLPEAQQVRVDTEQLPGTRDGGLSLHQTSLYRVVTDYSRESHSTPLLTLRHVEGVEASAKGVLGHGSAKMAAQEMQRFSRIPLDVLHIDGLVLRLGRDELGRKQMSSKLPFDLRSYPAAKSFVAEAMLERLEKDMSEFAHRSNNEKVPQLRYMSKGLVQAMQSGDVSQRDVVSMLGRIEESVLQAKKVDERYVEMALNGLELGANWVPEGPDGDVFRLGREAGWEVRITHDFLFAALLSTRGVEDLQKLNPFLSEVQCRELLDLVAYAVMHAGRLGQLNVVRREVAALAGMVKSGRGAGDAALSQKADLIASLLCQERTFVSQEGGAMVYDPRFLIFEFIWNILLRGRQVEMVRDFLQAHRQGSSHIKQMIMGAGKTTVVGPLLALNVAEGNTLLLQVVPASLLDFTCNILRSTFSAVIRKQVYTFECGRMDKIDRKTRAKFDLAKDTRAVVISTPTSLKSVWLKYLEMLDVAHTAQNFDSLKLVSDVGGVLELWRGGTLLLDEVDLILHPLKSELNFPIGPKQDVDFAPTRWRVPMHLFDAIFYPSLLRTSAQFKDSDRAHRILKALDSAVQEGYHRRALQYTPHLILLNKEYYTEHLKPLLAEWSILFLELHHVALPPSHALQYLMNPEGCGGEITEVVAGLPPYQIKLLNLFADWLMAYLPHCLAKINRVSYGMLTDAEVKNSPPNMPRSRTKLAVPFIGKDQPSPASEFAHPDIVLGLTLLSYRLQGLRNSDLSEVVQALHRNVEAEVGRFSQRRTNLLYEAWVKAAGGRVLQAFNYRKKGEEAAVEGDGLQPSESFELMRDHSHHADGEETEMVEVAPLRLLKQANEAEVRKIFKLFKLVPEVVHWYTGEVVFPDHMRHQSMKLSASGQELGGDMLFGVRLGFSGTPSDLLPVELGSCEYEKATDGQLITTLTDPSVVSLEQHEGTWSVRGLLDTVAQADPPYHALIDTGALITGMENKQVAQYLLRHGLKSHDGVVYLDNLDRKVVLVRATNRVLKLEECGIPVERRFAFYDQVHTTGIDIAHSPNARAALTLGKDMTFRDYSQGAYRMRGIAKGQTVRIVVIPEVSRLVERELQSTGKGCWEGVGEREKLCNIVSWLLLNSMKAERMQFNQLAVQTVANVWRKRLFAVVLQNPQSQETAEALLHFKESVSHEVRNTIPKRRLFSEFLESFVGERRALCSAGDPIIQEVLDKVRRQDRTHRPNYDVEIVQEQEEEKEEEANKEQVQEIEIEKFVDQAYSRESEAPEPWKLSTLRSTSLAKQFYLAEHFRLYHRRPLQFPPGVMVSQNYFNPDWTGCRRIRNTILTLEWVPSLRDVDELEAPTRDYCSLGLEESRRLLQHIFEVYGEDVAKVAPQVLSLALGESFVGEEVRSLADVASYLASNKGRGEQKGRFTVAVSLAEGETLYRVLHACKEKGAKFLFGGDSDTHIALRCLPSNNMVLGETAGFPDRREYQVRRDSVTLRFLDCAQHYSPEDLSLLLRTLHISTMMQRRLFFQQVLACRRRMHQGWEKAPVAKLFRLANAFTLLVQRAVGAAASAKLRELGVSAGDAFLAFNLSKSGNLTPAEVANAMAWLGVRATVDDILDFIASNDSQGDGNLNYKDLVSGLLRDEEDEEEETGGEEVKLDVPPVAPGLESTMQEHAAKRRQQLAASESEAQRLQEEEDRKVGKLITEEEDRLMQEEGGLMNPRVEGGVIEWNFTCQRLPKGCFGSGKTQRGAKGWEVMADSSIHVVMPDEGATYRQYALTFEVRMPRKKAFPILGAALVELKGGGAVIISQDGKVQWEFSKDDEEEGDFVLHDDIDHPQGFNVNVHGNMQDMLKEATDESSDEGDISEDEGSEESDGEEDNEYKSAVDFDFDLELMDAKMNRLLERMSSEAVPQKKKPQLFSGGMFGPRHGDMSDSSEEEIEEEPVEDPEEKEKREAEAKEQAAKDAEEEERRRIQREEEERGLPKTIALENGEWHIITLLVDMEAGKGEPVPETTEKQPQKGLPADEDKEGSSPEYLRVFVDGRKVQVETQPAAPEHCCVAKGMTLFYCSTIDKEVHTRGGQIRTMGIEGLLQEPEVVEKHRAVLLSWLGHTAQKDSTNKHQQNVGVIQTAGLGSAELSKAAERARDRKTGFLKATQDADPFEYVVENQESALGMELFEVQQKNKQTPYEKVQEVIHNLQRTHSKQLGLLNEESQRLHDTMGQGGLAQRLQFMVTQKRNVLMWRQQLELIPWRMRSILCEISQLGTDTQHLRHYFSLRRDLLSTENQQDIVRASLQQHQLRNSVMTMKARLAKAPPEEVATLQKKIRRLRHQLKKSAELMARKQKQTQEVSMKMNERINSVRIPF